MPVARKCSFCWGRVEPGSGLMLVRRDGSIMFFCSSKCERSFDLGRKPHLLKWTERSRKMRGKT